MKAIVMTCQFTRFSSRVDGSVGFGGCTPELTAPEKCALFELQNLNCRLLIEPVDYVTDGKREVKSQLETKTPSQRLRAVLFVLFKQQTDKGNMAGISFDSFYTDYINKQCEDVKSQLDQE